MSSIWSDARTFLDIFIVSLIIYRLLVLIVGTRAVQLLKGVLILVLFSALASMLRFRLVSWLIGQSLWALSFAIPIVFQPELRKMLEEIGRGNLWQRQLPRDVAEQRVRHIMGALGYMKVHRIGALLVLQEETGLGEYYNTAVHLDANITQELIISIFWKDNPLHDGALIMNRYSLIAGGCYLPLIDAPEISRWYGTRHRAALGLSEISDAIVLVVSEERGEISLAFKGHLSKNLKDAQVEKLLMHYFVGEPTFRSWRDRLQSFQQLLWDPSTRQLHEDHSDRS
ncbi:diadenylate cyclase CdaA [uncultured Fretibacterium sp.]|mgnify:FL=1|uniref:diadenylate cyclase CdaA n=1 Tax=uncultured Fretibacterium sp. TaxID=1678694 RepID=UPI00260DD1C3|nr:diadenylate cyclase CdaA [uncultured Fretibacterium sp.]